MVILRQRESTDAVVGLYQTINLFIYKHTLSKHELMKTAMKVKQVMMKRYINTWSNHLQERVRTARWIEGGKFCLASLLSKFTGFIKKEREEIIEKLKGMREW